jgi:hypothetical protein
MLKHQIVAVLATTTLFVANEAKADLVDGSFESADPWAYAFFNGGLDTPWQTTAPDNLIEIWNGNNMGVVPYDGTNFAELNANYASALYQDVNGLGDLNAINWHFAHRGRDGYDVMQLTITDMGANQSYDGGLVDDTILFQQQFGADNLAWQFHFGTVTSIGNLTRFSFEAISAVGGNTQGNFIDYAGFGQNAIPGPGPIALIMVSSILINRRRR